MAKFCLKIFKFLKLYSYPNFHCFPIEMKPDFTYSFF